MLDTLYKYARSKEINVDILGLSLMYDKQWYIFHLDQSNNFVYYWPNFQNYKRKEIKISDPECIKVLKAIIDNYEWVSNN